MVKLFNDNERECIVCDGAGLMGGFIYHPSLCPGCNGHGVVLFINNRVVKYGVGTRNRCMTTTMEPDEFLIDGDRSSGVTS